MLQSGALQEPAAFPLAEEAIREDFAEMIEACRDTLQSVHDSEQFSPGLEELRQVSTVIAEQGYPFADFSLDMPHYEKILAFSKDVQAGQDAQAVIYYMRGWRLYADILTCRDRELSLQSLSYSYREEDDISTSLWPIEELSMTEKGYLLCKMPEDCIEAYTGYRITPLGEELRGLCRKYVEGLGYYPNFMLRYDWDAHDLSALNLEWAYESLYNKFLGLYPDEAYTETDDKGRTQIPMQELESFMALHLPVTPEQLQAAIPYDEEAGAYLHTPFAGGGYSPLPEVVAAQENADGSLTMTVDAVAADFGDDRTTSCQLTVAADEEGNLQYLSNKVLIPFDGEEAEGTASPAAIGLTPKGEGLTDRENFFLDFAEQYAIDTLDLTFDSPDELSETEKYRIFLFLCSYFEEEPLDEINGPEKNPLYDDAEQAFVIPLSFVNGYLETYLGTGIAKPEEALGGLYGGNPNYRYDAKRSAFLVPSLSGFGGWRNFGLIDSRLEDSTYTLTLGLYDPGAARAGDAGYEVTQTVQMRIALTGGEPADFRLLSYAIIG